MDFAIFFKLLWAVMAITGGLVGLWSAAYASTKGRSSTSWQPVPGKILRSRLVRDHGHLEPRIAYRYWFNETEYEGERVRLISFASNVRSLVQPVLDRYGATQEVTVFVNPSDPSEAVLEPGGQPAGVLSIAVGALLLLGFGAYVLFRTLAPLFDTAGAA